MKFWIAMHLLLALGIAGCGISTLVKDNKTGREEATQEERDRIAEGSQRSVDLLKNVPYVGTWAGFLIPVFGFFGFAALGRQKRLKDPKSSTPFTGYIGTVPIGIGKVSVTAEQVVQLLSNANDGLMDWFKEDSATRRGFKTLLSYGIAMLSAFMTLPAAQEFIRTNTWATLGIGILTAAVAMINKFLEKVKPVTPEVASPTTT